MASEPSFLGVFHGGEQYPLSHDFEIGAEAVSGGGWSSDCSCLELLEIVPRKASQRGMAEALFVFSPVKTGLFKGRISSTQDSPNENFLGWQASVLPARLRYSDFKAHVVAFEDSGSIESFDHIIDTRMPEDFSKKSLRGAVNMPLVFLKRNPALLEQLGKVLFYGYGYNDFQVLEFVRDRAPNSAVLKGGITKISDREQIRINLNHQTILVADIVSEEQIARIPPHHVKIASFSRSHEGGLTKEGEPYFPLIEIDDVSQLFDKQFEEQPVILLSSEPEDFSATDLPSHVFIASLSMDQMRDYFAAHILRNYSPESIRLNHIYTQNGCQPCD